jgi:hypothetical protein
MRKWIWWVVAAAALLLVYPGMWMIPAVGDELAKRDFQPMLRSR